MINFFRSININVLINHVITPQFTFQEATSQQNAFHTCPNACGLTTILPNRKSSQLALHPNALPSIMDWPININFKVSWKLINRPEDWNTTPTKPSPHANYDFNTFSPLKKFKFAK